MKYDPQQHRDGCGCAHCEARRKRYEAVGVLVTRCLSYIVSRYADVYDGLDAVAELLRPR